MTQEKKLWLIVQNILDTHGDNVDDISIHDGCDSMEGIDESFKIYCSKGYCWEIHRELICDPEEVWDFAGVDEDGWCYNFTEPWEGFKESGIYEAINILGQYGRPEPV